MSKFFDKLKINTQNTISATQAALAAGLDAVERADEETAKKRIEICVECPHLIKITRQCKECGCFVDLKTKLKTQRCPIEKW